MDTNNGNDFTSQEDQVKKLTQQLTEDEKFQDKDFYSQLSKKEARIARHDVKKEMDKIGKLHKEALGIIKDAQATWEEKEAAQKELTDYVKQAEELYKKYESLTRRIEELNEDRLQDIKDAAEKIKENANKIKENALDSMTAGADKAAKMAGDGIDAVTAFPGEVVKATADFKDKTAAAISVAADTLENTVEKAKIQGLRPFKGLAEKGRSLNRAYQQRCRSKLMQNLNKALKVKDFVDKFDTYKENQANRKEEKRVERAEVRNSFRSMLGLKPKEIEQKKTPAKQKDGTFKQFLNGYIDQCKTDIMETYNKEIISLQNTIDSRQQTIDRAKNANYTRLENQLEKVNQQIKQQQQDVMRDQKIAKQYLDAR